MSIINRQLSTVSAKLSARILSTATANSATKPEIESSVESTATTSAINSNNNTGRLIQQNNIQLNKSLFCANFWTRSEPHPEKSESSDRVLSWTTTMPLKELVGQARNLSTTTYCDMRGMDYLKGVNLLREPNVNKDMAFTEEERKKYNLQGLLPAAIRPQNLQVQIIMENLRQMTDDLAKYMFLRDLQDHNKRLFYQVLQVHTKELMPIVYTPIVGLACQKYSLIFKRPRGLFITIKDLGNVYDILSNWESDEIKAIVVTDGERILGLGDLGANGMGIPVGKMALYSAIGGIPPELTLPVTLDVGTNNESLLADPYYIGVKEKRVTDDRYHQLVDEFMNAVVQKWGKACLIQFEDFGNKNAFKFLSQYKDKYCMFNDDIQGTAAVAVAGVIASCRITGGKIKDHSFVFLGAGEAALGIANLLVMAMVKDGLSREEACNRISLMDSQGLVTSTRGGRKDEHKEVFSKNLPDTKDLLEVITRVKPTCLIGAAAVPGAFNETILRKMAEMNDRPVIFALSNPTSKAECTAENAYKFTNGKCIFASGSPFDKVTLNGKEFNPGQGNNAYIFPGVAMAVMASQAYVIPDEVFLIAAESVADDVSSANLETGSVYPSLECIDQTSIRLAVRVSEFLFANGYTIEKNTPKDMLKFIKSHLYDASYDGSEFSKHIREAHEAWHINERN